MDHITTRVAAAQGKAIPADLIAAYGEPLLLDVINERWQRTGRGVTVEVLLAPREGEDAQRQIWHEVGTALSTGLLSLGGSYGLYLHTPDLAFDTVLSWVRAATANNAPAFVDLALTSRPPFAGFAGNTETVRCCLFQSSYFSSWIGALWLDATPGNFFDPGFVLAAYEGNVTKGMGRDAPLTEAAFAATLYRALGWLIPYGDPPMFIVGLPPTSDLYRDLVASPPHELPA